MTKYTKKEEEFMKNYVKRIENEFKNLKEDDDKSQKIKKIVYTTEVYFE